MKTAILCFWLFAGTALSVFAGTATRPANHRERCDLPPLTIFETVKKGELKLVPVARHSKNPVCENSGLAPCSAGTRLFWTINDSGNEPKIFAIDLDGKVYGNGVKVTHRRNIDWECISRDTQGNLIIGDVGNNRSNRKNLVFYIVPEPKNVQNPPFTEEARKISFYYPSQDNFVPANNKNYDCESCFAADGNFIYFFTKHWADTQTVLWRVRTDTEAYQAAQPLLRFDAGGMVTDAALSPSQKKLAVLLYHGLWIFDVDNTKTEPRERFFNNPHFYKTTSPILDWQTEGVAFVDEKTLVISSESGALFCVPVE
ncbi:MAG: hypothetical protein K6B46_03170 [Opitutales bacterium]|nr:hypothetical protein [Opitutales bacterium]